MMMMIWSVRVRLWVSVSLHCQFGPPQVPDEPSVTDITNTSATVSWTDPRFVCVCVCVPFTAAMCLLHISMHPMLAVI